VTGAEGRARLRSAATWFLLLCVVYLAWPAQLGGSLGLVVVSGHSMDGTYRSGDLLVTWPHDTYRTGDVVVYRVPDHEVGHGLRVVHRIIASDDGHYTTQGDNRDTADIWHPTVADVEGRPVLRVPAGGVVMRWLLSPLALALTSGLCVYLLIVGTDDEQTAVGDRTRDSTDREAPEHVAHR
jgi:signal peptidase